MFRSSFFPGPPAITRNTILPSIAAGKYDSEITGFANAVESQLSPYGHILIRPFWEFNFTGSEWNDVHYGNNPASVYCRLASLR